MLQFIAELFSRSGKSVRVISVFLVASVVMILERPSVVTSIRIKSDKYKYHTQSTIVNVLSRDNPAYLVWQKLMLVEAALFNFLVEPLVAKEGLEEFDRHNTSSFFCGAANSNSQASESSLYFTIQKKKRDILFSRPSLRKEENGELQKSKIYLSELIEELRTKIDSTLTEFKNLDHRHVLTVILELFTANSQWMPHTLEEGQKLWDSVNLLNQDLKSKIKCD